MEKINDGRKKCELKSGRRAFVAGRWHCICAKGLMDMRTYIGSSVGSFVSATQPHLLSIYEFNLIAMKFLTANNSVQIIFSVMVRTDDRLPLPFQ